MIKPTITTNRTITTIKQYSIDLNLVKLMLMDLQTEQFHAFDNEQNKKYFFFSTLVPKAE